MPGFEKCASYEKWTGYEKWVRYEEWVRYEKWTECVIHTRCMPNRGSEASWVILTPGVSILGRGQWRLHSQISYHFGLKISPPASNWMYLFRIFASNLKTLLFKQKNSRREVSLWTWSVSTGVYKMPVGGSQGAPGAQRG